MSGRFHGTQNLSAAGVSPLSFADRYCLYFHHLLTLYLDYTVYIQMQRSFGLTEHEGDGFHGKESEAGID